MICRSRFEDGGPRACGFISGNLKLKRFPENRTGVGLGSVRESRLGLIAECGIMTYRYLQRFQCSFKNEFLKNLIIPPEIHAVRPPEDIHQRSELLHLALLKFLAACVHYCDK